MAAVAVTAVVFAATLHSDRLRPVKATSPDPRLATRQEKTLHGVLWGHSYDQAREIAEQESRPILIYFSSITDANSRMMEASVLSRSDVVPWLSGFVTVKLPIDYSPIDSLAPGRRWKLGEQNQELQLDLIREAGSPFLAVTDAHGLLIAARGGYCEARELIGFLKSAVSVYRSRTSPARAGHPGK
jgi:hypothetical protein